MGLHNTHIIHVLNYTRNVIKTVDTKQKKTFSCPFLKLLPNIGKWDSFPENALWKMNNFSENINAETNRAYLLL